MSERVVEYPWVLENIDLIKGDVLDVGCGDGAFTRELVEKGYKVCGLDVDHCPHIENCINIMCDIRRTLLSDESFDRIISISTIEHVGIASGENNVDDDFKAMKEIRRILKPSGAVLITLPYGKTFYQHKTGFRIYDEKRLSRLFESFKIIKKDFFKNMDYPNKSPSDNWVKSDEKDAIDSQDVNMIVCVKAMK